MLFVCKRKIIGNIIQMNQKKVNRMSDKYILIKYFLISYVLI